MYQQQKPVPGMIYTFEGKKYQIVAMAWNTETEEEMVVYQALYGDFKVYTSPLSKLEKEEEKQEKEEKQISGNEKEEKHKDAERKKTESEENREDIHPKFRQFLDAETTNERLSILRDMREILDDTMINSIAVVMDVTVKEGRLEDRYDELLHCIQVKQQYELNRFR